MIKEVMQGTRFRKINRDLLGQKGQMLIVVILTMVVALTVGLSVASRTITNLKISKQNEESQRAFQAAEAGIEQALKNAGAGAFSDELSNKATFSTTIVTADGTNLLLNNGDEVDQSVGIDVWLSNYPSYQSPQSGSFTLYWATTETGCNGSGATIIPALEVVMLSVVNPAGSLSDPANLVLTKQIIEASPCARITGAASSGGAGTVTDKTGNSINFKYSTPAIPYTNGLIMKVIPVFNSTKIGAISSVAFPSQGSLIESTGRSGETVRKVVYFQPFPQIPIDLFPYSILSPNYSTQ